MLNRKRLVVLGMMVAAATGCTEASQGAQDGSATLTEPLIGSRVIQGVKWKNDMYCQDHAIRAGFETQGLTYESAVRKLCNHGVKDIVLKIAEPSILDWHLPTSSDQEGMGQPECNNKARSDGYSYPSNTLKGPCHGLSKSQCVATRDNEIIKMLKAIKAIKAEAGCEDMRAFVWQRQWMYLDSKVTEYVDEMSALINLARSNGVGDTLDGIAPIEVHLGGSCQVKDRALDIPRRINAKTGGWLKNKAWMFPGAGNGAWFVGINSGASCMSGDAFFEQLASEVRYFAFIYKQMAFDQCVEGNCQIRERHLGNPDAGIPGWDEMLGGNSAKTVEERKQWLLDDSRGMGVQSLIGLIDAQAAKGRGWLANVVFWGDSGDGIHLIDDRTFRAVHDIFIYNGGAPRSDRYRNYFFNMPLVREQGDSLWPKVLLKLSDSNNTSENNDESCRAVDNMGVYDCWKHWSSGAAYPPVTP
jgi:hypothetical protein